MSGLVEQIESSIRARGLFRSGQRVLVAVSGGLDSMVLLRVLHGLAAGHGWKLAVAHFNHQLRGAGSDGDERLVRRVARRLGLTFVAGRGPVAEFARHHGLSVEMAARRLRHDFLAGTALQLGIPTVALAHHADDQVELFFLRLLRGAGGEGLAGMKWSNPSPSAPGIRLVRPLLDVPKTALQSFAAEHKIAFAEDPTNASTGIQRNRIRHELIPLLTRHYQSALSKNILRTMELVGAESEWIGSLARQWLKGKRRPVFHRLPVAVQRRVIQQQLMERGVAPEFELIERLRGATGQWITVSVETSALRDASGAVRWRRLEPLEYHSDRQEVSLTGRKKRITFGGLKIHWDIADGKGSSRVIPGGNVEYFDADKVEGPICLRCWQPGDRFQPIGTGSARKLQDLFTNLKVPAAERRRRVVAATRQGKLFWVEGLRMAEKFKLDGRTARKLKWSWQRASNAVMSQLRTRP